MKSIVNAARYSFLTAAIGLFTTPSNALVIGHFDDTRELFGMSTGYISQATQWLVDEGHTLVSTNNADQTFLSGVDAFYTGLITTVSDVEISAMQSFVDNDGGFLFIQQDHGGGIWHAPSRDILSNWGIVNSAQSVTNLTAHMTTSSSDWVNTPNTISTFRGAIHSYIDTTPESFEVLATDSRNRTTLGVFDAGAGRSSDVLVATDIDFWSNDIGWLNTNNQGLWENIWSNVSIEIGDSGSTPPNNPEPGDDNTKPPSNGGIPVVQVPEPSSLVLISLGITGIYLSRRRKQ